VAVKPAAPIHMTNGIVLGWRTGVAGQRMCTNADTDGIGRSPRVEAQNCIETSRHSHDASHRTGKEPEKYSFKDFKYRESSLTPLKPHAINYRLHISHLLHIYSKFGLKNENWVCATFEFEDFPCFNFKALVLK
jgi:hypothetical protein